MRDTESLIFGLLFLAVVGFQVFKQFLAARAEQQRRLERARGNAGATATTSEAPEDTSDPFALLESDWGRAPEPVPALPLEVRQVPKPKPARPRGDKPIAAQVHSRARHRLFHSQQALRHGIVMMTVLGPCRAAKPYDQDL
jgi:hypothetical protein